MRMYVENIDQNAHTADLRCGKQGCDYAAEGVDLNTHAQVKWAETLEGVTINGNVLSSVATPAALPAAGGGSENDVRHVVTDDAQDTIPAGGANLYVIKSGAWQRVNAAVAVTCPTCGLSSTFPAFDIRNCVGSAMGKAKNA